jgi:hypothetical protein
MSQNPTNAQSWLFVLRELRTQAKLLIPSGIIVRIANNTTVIAGTACGPIRMWLLLLVEDVVGNRRYRTALRLQRPLKRDAQWRRTLPLDRVCQKTGNAFRTGNLQTRALAKIQFFRFITAILGVIQSEESCYFADPQWDVSNDGKKQQDRDGHHCKVADKDVAVVSGRRGRRQNYSHNFARSRTGQRVGEKDGEFAGSHSDLCQVTFDCQVAEFAQFEQFSSDPAVQFAQFEPQILPFYQRHFGHCAD